MKKRMTEVEKGTLDGWLSENDEELAIFGPAFTEAAAMAIGDGHDFATPRRVGQAVKKAKREYAGRGRKFPRGRPPLGNLAWNHRSTILHRYGRMALADGKGVIHIGRLAAEIANNESIRLSPEQIADMLRARWFEIKGEGIHATAVKRDDTPDL